MRVIANEADARSYVAGLADDEAVEKLDRLGGYLREENSRQNLVSAASLEVVWQRHFADSAQLLEFVPRETNSWLDLGTGAGLPGLVIAIMRPEISVTMVESRTKRTDWLKSMCDELGVANGHVVASRLELIETFPADVISARAFAPLPKLLDLAARFSTARTQWVLPKGRSAAQEVEELPAKRRKLFHVEQSLTDGDAGIIVGKGRVEARK